MKLLVVAFAFACISCGQTVSLSSGQISKKINYKVKRYSGCCGCQGKYFDIYVDGVKKNQIAYNYSCPSGMPTKFVFDYDEEGNLEYCERYIATMDNDFEITITSEEIIILANLERSNSLMINGKYISLTQIKGFRKPKEGEPAQLFVFGESKAKIR